MKAWTMMLMLVGLVMASCKKDLVEPLPAVVDNSGQVGDQTPNDGECNQVLTFLDPGICSGMWFQTASGEILEVYGYSQTRAELDLKVGETITAGYNVFACVDGFMCQAISEFEAQLWDAGTPYSTVVLTCENGKVKDIHNGDCDESVTFMDAGLCGGAWFLRSDGTYLEVYDYPLDREHPRLERGDEVSLSYEAYDTSKLIECEALGEFEAKLYESGATIEIVKATCY